MNVDPVGQEHGWSMSPQGGREAELSKGRAKATAVIRCNILENRTRLTGRLTGLGLLEEMRPGPNPLYKIKSSQDLDSHVIQMPSKAVPRYSMASSGNE